MLSATNLPRRLCCKAIVCCVARTGSEGHETTVVTNKCDCCVRRWHHQIKRQSCKRISPFPAAACSPRALPEPRSSAASAAEAATFGNPDEPAEGAVNVINPKALTDPGPQDPDLANNEPAFLNPPATDINGMPQYWASFNLAPKRIQNGGWARQVTQDDFKISTTIAAVKCASVQAAFASFIGTSRRNGRS